jgi:hypothetical protein
LPTHWIEYRLAQAFESLLQLDTGFSNQLSKSFMFLPVQLAKLGWRDGPGLPAQALEAGFNFGQF